MIIDIPAFWYVAAVFIWFTIALACVGLLVEAFVHYCEWKDNRQGVIDEIIERVKVELADADEEQYGEDWNDEN